MRRSTICTKVTRWTSVWVDLWITFVRTHLAAGRVVSDVQYLLRKSTAYISFAMMIGLIRRTSNVGCIPRNISTRTHYIFRNKKNKNKTSVCCIFFFLVVRSTQLLGIVEAPLRNIRRNRGDLAFAPPAVPQRVTSLSPTNHQQEAASLPSACVHISNAWVREFLINYAVQQEKPSWKQVFWLISSQVSRGADKSDTLRRQSDFLPLDPHTMDIMIVDFPCPYILWQFWILFRFSVEQFTVE